mmetsp:Transcript_13811/g.51518  ORF Transcript_13811/g.51518 Transcript_13811/m.51518 type:complete len:308 (+) Transcript_13811:2472-3395(+)
MIHGSVDVAFDERLVALLAELLDTCQALLRVEVFGLAWCRFCDHRLVPQVEHRSGTAREFPRLQAHHHRAIRPPLYESASPVGSLDFLAHRNDRSAEGARLQEAPHWCALGEFPAVQGHTDGAVITDLVDASTSVDGQHFFPDSPLLCILGRVGCFALGSGGSGGSGGRRLGRFSVLLLLRRFSLGAIKWHPTDHGSVLEVKHRPRLPCQLPRVEAHNDGAVGPRVRDVPLAIRRIHDVASGKGRLGDRRLLQEAVHGGVLCQSPAAKRHADNSVLPKAGDAANAVGGEHLLALDPVASFDSAGGGR